MTISQSRPFVIPLQVEAYYLSKGIDVLYSRMLAEDFSVEVVTRHTAERWELDDTKEFASWNLIFTCVI